MRMHIEQMTHKYMYFDFYFCSFRNFENSENKKVGNSYVMFDETVKKLSSLFLVDTHEFYVLAWF